MRFFKIDYIKIFKSVLFTLMFLLLGIQLFLTIPSFKTFISDLGLTESIYTMTEPTENIYGELTLKLIGAESNGDIIVLQNGEPVAAFFSDTVRINVPDNTVIEIDGTSYKGSFFVETVDHSDNISDFTYNKSAVNGNIVIIDRYFLK